MQRSGRLMAAVVIIAVSVASAGCGGRGPSPEAGSGSTRMAAQDTVDRPGRAAALTSLADTLSIVDPPEIEVVRETSPFDFDQTQVDCLRAAGYDVSLGEGGGISFQLEAGDDFRQQFQMASYSCQAQYPLAEVYYAPLTAEQKEAYADYYLVELPHCLNERGVSFETPPSREVFLSQFDASGVWNPYSSAQIIGSEVSEVMAACPQMIPPDRVWKRPS